MDGREDVRTERRDRRRQDRLDQIVKAGAEIIAEVGYDATTLEMIGEAVGLSATGLYYYVKGKDDLLATLYETALDTVLDEAARRTPSGASPGVRLRHLVTAQLEFALTDPIGRALALLHGQVLSRSQPLGAHAAMLRYVDYVGAIFADGIADRSMALSDPDLGIDIVGGAIYGVALRLGRSAPPAAARVRALVRQTADFVVRGATS